MKLTKCMLNGVPQLRKLLFFILLSLIAILMTSCQMFDKKHVDKIGILIEGPLEENSWEERGYNGLIEVKEQFDIHIFLEENVNSQYAISRAVSELVDDGVTLIFGHGNFYGKYFNEIAEQFPDVHFVYFNGGYYKDNLTSLNFDSHAMGFFSGMIAGKVTETNQIGIVAAHEWQPEIEGFYEGVKFENSQSDVHINFVNDWNKQERVKKIYDQMISKDVDVIYPTGELFSEELLERAVDDHIFAIGYGIDQSYINEQIVLTSTIQHVDKLYIVAVKKAVKDTLSGGVFYYDFQDGVISLGPFSEEIPHDYQRMINDYIETYKNSNLLPNEL